MHEYQATITRVIDGDTVEADVDLGFGVFMHRQTFRMDGIQAPEMRDGFRGIQSSYALEQLVEGYEVTLRTTRNRRGVDQKGKYGRWLATILIPEMGNLNVNEWMVSEGHATVYE